MVDDIYAAVCCASCGEQIQEVEPEGWWAGELDSMKQELEEMIIKMEVAEDKAEAAWEKVEDMKAELRSAKRDAIEEANQKNFNIGIKLCELTKVIDIMDAMIRADGPPTRDEVNTLNDIRRRGGLSPL